MNIDIAKWARGIAVSIGSTAALAAGGTVIHTAARVDVVEAQRTDDIGRLTRIEDKVDKLLERAVHADNGK